MSISFTRDGREVVLNEFSNKEVINYLNSKLNACEPRFKVVANPVLGKSIMVKFDDINFIVFANYTWIEISFEQANSKKMAVVINKITKWSRFSKKEKTFYVQFDDGDSCTIIFENGHETPAYYRERFNVDDSKITVFFNH